MAEEFLDAKNLICPLPVLKARKKLLSMQSGDILNVEFTDSSAQKDFKLFCEESGYVLKEINEERAVIAIP